MPINFARICHIEPEISEIYALAKATKNREGATQLWRSNLQPRLGTLVGTRAKTPALRPYDVFALTIETIRAALHR